MVVVRAIGPERRRISGSYAMRASLDAGHESELSGQRDKGREDRLSGSGYPLPYPISGLEAFGLSDVLVKRLGANWGQEKKRGAPGLSAEWV